MNTESTFTYIHPPSEEYAGKESYNMNVVTIAKSYIRDIFSKKVEWFSSYHIESKLGKIYQIGYHERFYFWI